MNYNNAYPAPFDLINIAGSSATPVGLNLTNNASFAFFARYLWQKLLANFRFTFPKNWDAEFCKLCLFGDGRMIVLNTQQFGVIPQNGTLGGFRVMYNPDFAMIGNALLPDYTGRELVIGRDCEVVRIAPDFMGAGDLVGFYAAKMALCSVSIDTNLFNTRLAYVFGAKNKAQAESFKKMYDQISSGQPAVFIDKNLFSESDGGELAPHWQLFEQNLKQTYLVPEILSDLRKIEEEFDTKIGIPNANTDKRERLITDEVNANNVETAIIAEGWLENIREGFTKVAALYPDIKCSVDWRVKPNVLESAGTGKSNDSGSL